LPLFLINKVFKFKKNLSKMKKVFMSMIAVALISLAACTGGKKQAESAAPETETATEKATDVSSSKLDEYKKLIEEATPLFSKMAQGDAEAAAQYQEIAQKIAAIATELGTELANDPEKLKELEEIGRKFAEELQKTVQAPQQ
jgi:uncharacterized phage infection (PIP) family protein YhgE